MGVEMEQNKTDEIMPFLLKDFLVTYYAKNLNWKFIMKGEDGQPLYIVQAEEFFDYSGFLPGFAHLAFQKQQELGIQAFMLNIEEDPDGFLKKRIAFEKGTVNNKLRFLVLALLVDSIETICGRAIPNKEIDVNTLYNYFNAPNLQNELKLPCNTE